MSTSTSLLRSMMMSPPMAHPAVPYPPAFTEGESECLAQNRMILEWVSGSELLFNQKPTGTHLLTSSASSGQATAFDKLFTFPLNIVEYSEKLESNTQRGQLERERVRSYLGSPLR